MSNGPVTEHWLSDGSASEASDQPSGEHVHPGESCHCNRHHQQQHRYYNCMTYDVPVSLCFLSEYSARTICSLLKL